ncbi:MAG: bifunctional hydroxymethylpyrimidine kinase/phosphomethylpyrimidine kinase [Desulfobacterales bacterium]|nr:bifunctional hydroxymethylpyrimidine kinase/phosphomethylpyrimidine kinase [Desulfobacterales bacterium]
MKTSVQRVAAIHDLSGFGRASLTVVMPILSTMGIQVCPLPTAVLSTHSKFPDYYFVDLTEAALLLDRPYNPAVSTAEIKEWIVDLAARGPRIVIVTSVPEMGPGHKTAVIAYDREDRRFWKVGCEYLPTSYPGTGDAFASVVVGSLLQGDSLPMALDRAVQFISLGVRATFGYAYDSHQGILLERILGHLRASVPLSSYELLD